MAYVVNITPRAERDLTHLYEAIGAETSDVALSWYQELKAAIVSLGEYPDRCPIIPENPHYRHLLHGTKHNIYRVIYRIVEKRKRVEVLHIRHGARDKFKG